MSAKYGIIIQNTKGDGHMAESVRKKNRLLEIFYRAVKGESLSIKGLAAEYGVSTKSISRDIGEIKNFLSDSRDLVGNTELKYAANSKTYYLEFEDFLLSKELVALIEMMLGCRAFPKTKMLEIVAKLKSFTTCHDRAMLNSMISKELYHYMEVGHDCKSVIDNVWQLTRCINEKIELSIEYYKAERTLVDRRIMPIAIMFSEYYYYLIAYRSDKDDWKPLYYRVDRIVNIVEHRGHFKIPKGYDFDEGELRKKIQFMFPGEYRKIRFAYSGKSVQAILDKLPTAKIVDVDGPRKIIEAETYGTGINMYLLSQGSAIEVLQPPELICELRDELEKMSAYYKSEKI